MGDFQTTVDMNGKEARPHGEGPYSNGKYAGWLDIYEGEVRVSSCYCTPPIFDSKEQALFKMGEIAADMNSWDKETVGPSGARYFKGNRISEGKEN